MLTRRRLFLILIILLVASGLLAVGLLQLARPEATVQPGFDGKRAYQDVVYQASLGPRTVGSPAHQKAVDWMAQNLRAAGWKVEIQQGQMDGHPIRNVIAQYGEGEPWVILGAHYDSRLQADHDPNPANHSTPVPGANDGASGVAVLMELARILPGSMESAAGFQTVWLVFFDGEDNGKIPGWDWILGSRMFAASLADFPQAVVILDMIGDAKLNIYQERSSDQQLTAEIWQTAEKSGYGSQFIANPGLSILDDHTPFLERGMRAVDIIDFDYPYYHTLSDTVDKVSPDSLQIVGTVMLNWLTQDRP